MQNVYKEYKNNFILLSLAFNIVAFASINLLILMSFIFVWNAKYNRVYNEFHSVWLYTVGSFVWYLHIWKKWDNQLKNGTRIWIRDQVKLMKFHQDCRQQDMTAINFIMFRKQLWLPFQCSMFHKKRKIYVSKMKTIQTYLSMLSQLTKRFRCS